MFKVVHVIWSATIGGIERVVMDLISQQQKNNDLEVSLLIGRRLSSCIQCAYFKGLFFGFEKRK